VARLLIVEDNRNLAHGLRTNLEYEGHVADIAEDGDTGLALARARSHELILLDLMLPGLDGLGLLETIRAEGIETPVLVLTARGDEADMVRGLRNGADDYVTKPFALRELLARVGALLRRTKAAPASLAFGSVVIDPTTHAVTRAGEAVQLRPKEYELLHALVRRGGRVATRSELLREVWGYQDSVVSRTLDTHVGELRRKLEEDPARPRHILTVRKTGYRLAAGT
jgi:DNA-binding response OmpR family regulator